jgi:separase
LPQTHYHGHHCHHVKEGCYSCKTHFCYRCLATAEENRRERGEEHVCKCGGWSGFCGALPSGGSEAHCAALCSSPLFLYFGHGAGTQFLPRSALRLRRCAAALALLMGCSSGALAQEGDLPPTGAATAYLAAGCGSLVANLWDVTDRDIDRFAEELLAQWLAAAEAGGEAAERGAHAGMDSARAACRLRALTGAAPVVFGLPARLLAEEGE